MAVVTEIISLRGDEIPVVDGVPVSPFAFDKTPSVGTEVDIDPTKYEVWTMEARQSEAFYAVNSLALSE